MKRLPSMNAKDVIRILKKFGFEESRQKGSHVVLFNPATKLWTVVPAHIGKDIKKPLLKKIIEDDAGDFDRGVFGQTITATVNLALLTPSFFAKKLDMHIRSDPRKGTRFVGMTG